MKKLKAKARIKTPATVMWDRLGGEGQGRGLLAVGGRRARAGALAGRRWEGLSLWARTAIKRRIRGIRRRGERVKASMLMQTATAS